jgi:hypothetical protein
MKLSSSLYLILAAEGVSAFVVSPSRSNMALVARLVPYSERVKLYGLLDEINSDEYNLMDTSGDSSDSGINSEYEVFLGDLVFSTNDPRVDIMSNYEQATDEKFISWMEKKAKNSSDPEERLALKDLHEMIVDIKKRADLSKMAEERAAREAGEKDQERLEQAEKDAEAGRQMSNADILRMASLIGTAQSSESGEVVLEKRSFFEEDLTPEIRMSYEDTLKKLLPPYKKTGETPRSVVAANYENFDAQFVKVLTERSTNGDEDSSALLEALAEEQSIRIAGATETLKSVLAMGEPMKMEGAIVKLAREGKIDEAFLLLLEANETQAKSAGATGPAELMKKLRMRAAEEKDKQIASKEIRLIRKLLRTDDATQREKILEDAFTPKEALLVRLE